MEEKDLTKKTEENTTKERKTKNKVKIREKKDGPVISAFNMVYEILRVILILLAVVLVAGYLLGFRIFIVESNSMKPTFSAGDTVLIKKGYSYDKVEKGDIIAYRSGTAIMTERVIDVADSGMVVQGDYSEEPEEYKVTKDTYFGKYMRKTDKLGNFLKFLNTSTGKVILVLIFFGLLLIRVLIDYRDEIFGKKRKKTTNK